MQNQRQLNSPAEPIELAPYMGRGRGRFLSFLICCALLIGAFSVSGALANRGGALSGISSLFGASGASSAIGAPPSAPAPAPSAPVIPDGATPIRSADLSRSELGLGYILNETHLSPDLSGKNFGNGAPISYDPTNGPAVLILHTHASEAYLPEPADYLTGEIGQISYSDDPERTVVAVGAVLCEELNKKGIPAIHCAEMHGVGGTLRHSYERAAECIQNYLRVYPTIRLVIDLHRDGILDADGAYVRTVAQVTGEEVAQIMAVVGTDCNGEDYPSWQSNLSLAVRLREGLSAISTDLPRPIYLRRSSYNQEIAPHSLLLEIGSGANTVEEAKSTARLAAEVLSDLLRCSDESLSADVTQAKILDSNRECSESRTAEDRKLAVFNGSGDAEERNESQSNACNLCPTQSGRSAQRTQDGQRAGCREASLFGQLSHNCGICRKDRHNSNVGIISFKISARTVHNHTSQYQKWNFYAAIIAQ